MGARVFVDPRSLPREIKELKIADGRPAFLFMDQNGHLPLNDICGKDICPYCKEELNAYKQCTCSYFKRALAFNSKPR